MCVYEQINQYKLTYYLQGLVMGTISGLQPFSMNSIDYLPSGTLLV